MNLTEAKALFFAQYYMQEVFVEPMMGAQNPMYFNGANIDDFGDDNYLLLRSVTQLTDEEKLILSCIYYGDMHLLETVFTHGTAIRKERIENAVGHYLHGNSFNVVVQNKYLIGVGVLRAFTYLNEENKPVTLQPDEIIALGWAKINEA